MGQGLLISRQGGTETPAAGCHACLRLCVVGDVWYRFSTCQPQPLGHVASHPGRSRCGALFFILLAGSGPVARLRQCRCLKFTDKCHRAGKNKGQVSPSQQGRLGGIRRPPGAPSEGKAPARPSINSQGRTTPPARRSIRYVHSVAAAAAARRRHGATKHHCPIGRAGAAAPHTALVAAREAASRLTCATVWPCPRKAE